ncbi:MAG: tyrosine recombinase XerC [Chloroflexi bacterium]|jgi:integrase/recombinase XerC|nr:tyrosine recombinase XerC [Chloroflexota bacterium]
MEEMLSKYVRYLTVERNLSPFTIRNYSTDILHFFNFLKMEEIESLEDIDHSIIRNYLGQLLDNGTVRASISRKMSALRSFFRYLNQQNIITNDPVSKISGPKQEKRLPTFLTSEEILDLLNAPDTSTPQGVRDLAILEMLYASGLRVSEIASLDMGSVDMETFQIRVWGKGAKERIVLMGQPAAEILQQYMDFGRNKLLGKKKERALFLNRYGQRIGERRIQHLIKKYAQQAGIGGRVFPHMLRHTFATHMLNGGADLRVVQELLGHANLASTQIYTHVTRSQMRSRYLEAHPRSQEATKTVRPPSTSSD